MKFPFTTLAQMIYLKITKRKDSFIMRESFLTQLSIRGYDTYPSPIEFILKLRDCLID